MKVDRKEPFTQGDQRYTRLQDEERQQRERYADTPLLGSFSTAFALFLCVVSLVLLLVLAALFSWDSPRAQDSIPEKSCLKPETRQEWRSLTPNQQREYTTAITCLSTKPSRMGLAHSLHDDFAYSHIWHGHDSHNGVSFLAYHRWFLHLYEMALRTECGYTGNMIYWDWSLDWQDPYGAPVFKPDSGFGGEGSRSVEGMRGYCVDQGPLPNYTVPFLETFAKPHCLSREFFTDKENLTRWAAEWKPAYLETILEETKLPTFIDRLEEGPHIALPKMLHGDFSTQGAPIDPIFMLHHTNLDRLYWLWQQRDTKHRLTEYHGRKTAEDTMDLASPEDKLVFGDLGPSVRVGDILRTEGEKLCYDY